MPIGKDIMIYKDKMLGDHIGVSLIGWVFTVGKHPRHNEDWDSIKVP